MVSWGQLGDRFGAVGQHQHMFWPKHMGPFLVCFKGTPKGKPTILWGSPKKDRPIRSMFEEPLLHCTKQMVNAGQCLEEPLICQCWGDTLWAYQHRIFWPILTVNAGAPKSFARQIQKTASTYLVAKTFGPCLEEPPDLFKEKQSESSVGKEKQNKAAGQAGGVRKALLALSELSGSGVERAKTGRLAALLRAAQGEGDGETARRGGV